MQQARKVAFYTLGCKLNYSETSSIARLFTESGYQTVDFHEGADVYVINTCSVTENADKKCRKIVKEALKHNAQAYITIVGCYAQLKPTEIANIPGVDMVLGAAEKFNLVAHINDLTKEKKAIVKNSEIGEVKDFIASWSYGDRTRTFLKVQDGCDYSCAFCTIPLARGESRSDTIENIVNNARMIAQTDVKEVVLTGVNIGDFGKNDKGSFLKLIQALDEVEGIERFRISSIEPNLLTNEIIEFVARFKRFVPHFHIPLQSGSDKILRLMRRRYKRDLYTERVAKIKSLMPDCCIGVDVIVGFPGETKEDFIDTYNFINGLDISYLHVFTYSERDNTAAIEFEGVVPAAERAERSSMLHILSDKKRRYFYEQQLGKTATILFEADCKDGLMHGFSKNYVKVSAKYDPALVNELIQVNLETIGADGCVTVSEVQTESLHHH